MYVQRWLSAPLAQPDGTLVSRDRGSPQGASISPLLANLFMHYAFDAWMAREFPQVPFERFVDDVIVHCVSQQQASRLRDAIAARLAECGGLRLHPTKTRIVYCKMTGRYGSHEQVTFDFLGYTFKPRAAKKKDGTMFTTFSPAISRKAATSIRQQIRRMRFHLRSASFSIIEVDDPCDNHFLGFIAMPSSARNTTSPTAAARAWAQTVVAINLDREWICVGGTVRGGGQALVCPYRCPERSPSALTGVDDPLIPNTP